MRGKLFAAVAAIGCFGVVSQGAVVADFTFGGPGGSLTSSVGGYSATLNGAAILGAGGVALTGGNITTNMPMSLLTGKSFTMEVLATNTNPGGDYQQLIGNHNDFGSFWGQYINTTQLFMFGDGLAAFGTGRQDDFVNDGQIHRYVTLLDATKTVGFEIWQFVDAKAPVGAANNGGFRSDPNVSMMEIGGENGSFNPYQGAIYRVRISDNVVASPDFISVPEPTSLGLLGLGIMALSARKRLSV